jgi:D-2-hydroxyacid dehydrogenase (NADP+)
MEDNMKVVTSELSDDELAVLKSVDPTVEIVLADTDDDVYREIADAEALIGPKPTPELLRRAERLRWIQLKWVGVSRMMFPELANSDIVLTNGRGITTVPIAEHTMALILAWARCLPSSVRNQKGRVWETHANLEVREIAGSTLGIVGLGRIGRQLARRASAFDMTIMAVDPVAQEKPSHVESLQGADGLHDLLVRSDCVVLCCPLTAETHGMIGQQEFQIMKSSAFFINISRGAIVDQAAMIEALREKEIAGAGLDATTPEPLPPESPLWEMGNVLITPHHAGCSPKAQGRVVELYRENLQRFIDGKPLQNVVDKILMY